jgi:hypothetical protein
MHTIVEAPTFLEGAEKAGVVDDVLDRVNDSIAFAPTRGERALGLEGLCLRSLPRAETGAEADLEVLFYFVSEDIPLFLLDICFAGDPLYLTKRDHIELAAVLSAIATEYRASARAKVIELRRARDGQNE